MYCYTHMLYCYERTEQKTKLWVKKGFREEKAFKLDEQELFTDDRVTGCQHARTCLRHAIHLYWRQAPSAQGRFVKGKFSFLKTMLFEKRQRAQFDVNLQRCI